MAISRSNLSITFPTVRHAPRARSGTFAACWRRSMAERRLGIIMNGVTGRMGMNQHLVRSILAIREQGGVALRNGDRVMPDPILLGRNRDKLVALARETGIE